MSTDDPIDSGLTRQGWRWWDGLLLALLTLILSAVALLYWASGDPQASRKLLEWVGERQHWVTYRYQGGTLRDGLQLNQVVYENPKLRVSVDRAVVKLGWRALLSRELHFSHAQLDHLQILKKTPPTGESFKFFDLRLPVTLRFDDAQVRNLDIITAPNKRVRLDTIILHDALWRDTRVTIKNSSLLLPALSLTGVDAQMDFTGRWPIRGTGLLAVSALSRQRLTPIQVRVNGPLDRLDVQGLAQWPDPLRLTGVVQPLESGVPYQGQLNWQAFHWPVAASQQLYSRQGQAQLSGTVQGLDLQVDTHLQGKNVPAGQYRLNGHTNWRGLQISQLDADILKGNLRAQGELGWHKGLNWVLRGQASGLQVRSMLPEAARAYAPEQLTGPVESVASLGSDRSGLGVQMRQQGGPRVLVGVGRLGNLGDSQLPMAIDARWSQLRQPVTGLGVIDSPEGRAQVLLHRGQTRIEGRLALAAGSRLPAGQYQARAVLDGRWVRVPQLVYQGMAGQLTGQAQLQRPAKTGQPLVWQADLDTTGFNPHALLDSVPFEQLVGQVQVRGRSDAQQHIVHVPAINLHGRLMAQTGQTARSLRLQGQGNAAVLMQPRGGMRSFAAQFTGQFNTQGVPGGTLVVDVAGTPQLIQIKKLIHEGEAGALNVRGTVGTAGGLRWNLNGQLRQFNPGYFVKGWVGRITGPLVTRGVWSAQQRDIQIDQMNLQGQLRNQPLNARGQLHLKLAQGKGIKLIQSGQWQARDLYVDWGGNRVTANGTQQAMVLRVDAQQLARLHPKLSGKVLGDVQVSGAIDRPDLKVDLLAEGLKFGTLSVARAKAQGTIRQLGFADSQLHLDVEQLSTGTQTVRKGSVQLAGTRQAHQLEARVEARQGRVHLRARGRLDAQLNWQGQLYDSEIGSSYATLRQASPAQVSWNQARQQATIAPHCWEGKGGSLCITEPILASPAKGMVSLNLRNLDIEAFEALMPNGVAWSGKINGQGKLGWRAGQSPSLDAVLYTDNGSIGLESEDPQDPPITLPYQRLSLLVKTEAEGLKVRFDAKTPGIGTGYIDTLINPRTKPMTINGALVLDNVEVGILKPFFPAMRVLSGTASLAGGMSGPLTSPEFYGNFKLNDGRLALNSVPVNLNRINLAAQIRGTQATLAGDFYSGDGKGTLTGNAVWAGTPRVALNLKGNELLVRQPPQLTARLNPDVQVVILPASRQVTVGGQIDVPSAVITPNSSGDKVVALSPDVRVVDRRQVVTAAEANPQKVNVPWQIDADLKVLLGQDVVFRGFGANVPLRGGLDLRSRGTGALTARGQIAVQRMVQVDAFGQSLMLRRGEVNFNGSLTQPVLAIEATKSVEGRTVGVRIGGKPTAPGIVIFNDAGLTEQEALNALLTGRISANNTLTNTAGFRSDVNNTLAAAGLSYGLTGVRNFTNEIGRSFGLSGLTLDAQGVGNDTQVNLTGYITPDLYLRYGMGVFTPVNKLTLRYQINRRLYVEASSALEKAIDIFYNWRF